MGKQTGRFSLASLGRQYRAPLAALALAGALLALDHRVRSGDGDAYGLGNRELEAGRFESAVRAYSAALRANPADSAARLGLGRAYQALGWAEEALKEYEMSATRAQETLKQSYLSLSALSEKLGNREEAKRYARAAQELRPQ
ncbi:MAG: tetratricopeptide repeat protein [Deltaproteobacteria bacterium]|nr:tetratricopeptide repeat protein [Deltaproteobacteria bacterium]